MKKNKKRLPRQVEAIKARGAGMAAATQGRARTFTDRKKKQAKNACRKNK
jgi:hypothetical protein